MELVAFGGLACALLAAARRRADFGKQVRSNKEIMELLQRNGAVNIRCRVVLL